MLVEAAMLHAGRLHEVGNAGRFDTALAKHASGGVDNAPLRGGGRFAGHAQGKNPSNRDRVALTFRGRSASLQIEVDRLLFGRAENDHQVNKPHAHFFLGPCAVVTGASDGIGRALALR